MSSPVERLAQDPLFAKKLKETRDEQNAASLDFAWMRQDRPDEATNEELLELDAEDVRATRLVQLTDQATQYGNDKVRTDLQNFRQTGELGGEAQPGMPIEDQKKLYQKLRENRTLLDYYEQNPEAIMQAPRDVEVLEQIGGVFTNIGKFFWEAGGNIIEGDDRQEVAEQVYFNAAKLSDARAAQMTSDRDRAANPLVRAFRNFMSEDIETIEANLAESRVALNEFNLAHPEPDAFSSAQSFQTAGQILDQFQGTTLAFLGGAAAGGAAGAGMGAAAAAPSGVGILPAAVGAGLTGAKVVGQANAARRIFNMERGSFYNELMAQGLSHDSAYGPSLLYGSLSTLVELWAFNTAAKMYGATGMKLLKGKLKSQVLGLMKNASTRIAMEDLGKLYLKNIAVEAGEEGIQTYLENFAAGLAKMEESGEEGSTFGLLIDTITSPEGFEEFKAATFAAGTGSAIFGVPSLGVNVATSTLPKIQQVHRDQSFFQGLSEGAEMSELREDSPGLFREFIGQIGEKTGLNTVFMSPDDVVKALSQSGLDMESAEQILPGLGQKYEDAVDQGRDIEIDMAEFAQKVAGSPDLMPNFRARIKLEETGITNERLEELYLAKVEDTEAELDGETADDIRLMNESADRVGNRIYEQLKASGRVSDKQAKEMSGVARMAFQTLAIQMSSPANRMTAEELFNDFPIDVTSMAIGQYNYDQSGNLVEDETFRDRIEGTRVANDQTGLPTRVYHGTKAMFDAFRMLSHFGTLQAAEDRIGVTDTRTRYEAGHQFVPGYLDIKNPLVLPDIGIHTVEKILNELQNEEALIGALDNHFERRRLEDEGQNLGNQGSDRGIDQTVELIETITGLQFDTEEEYLSYLNQAYGSGSNFRGLDVDALQDIMFDMQALEDAQAAEDVFGVNEQGHSVKKSKKMDRQGLEDQRAEILVEGLEAMGYDGFVYGNNVEDPGSVSWIPFRDSQFIPLVQGRSEDPDFFRQTGQGIRIQEPGETPATNLPVGNVEQAMLDAISEHGPEGLTSEVLAELPGAPRPRNFEQSMLRAMGALQGIEDQISELALERATATPERQAEIDKETNVLADKQRKMESQRDNAGRALLSNLDRDVKPRSFDELFTMLQTAYYEISNQGDWYKQFGEAISDLVGEANLQEASIIFGITSAQNSTWQNLKDTLRIMNAARRFNPVTDTQAFKNEVYRKGPDRQGISVTNRQLNQIVDMYKTGTYQGGLKVSSYMSLVQIRAANEFYPFSVQDVHMARAMGYLFRAINISKRGKFSEVDDARMPSDLAIRYSMMMTEQLGHAAGMSQDEVQALLWFYAKHHLSPKKDRVTKTATEFQEGSIEEALEKSEAEIADLNKLIETGQFDTNAPIFPALADAPLPSNKIKAKTDPFSNLEYNEELLELAMQRAPTTVASANPGQARGYGFPLDTPLSVLSEYQDRVLDAITDEDGQITFLRKMGIPHVVVRGYGTFDRVEPNFTIYYPGSDFDRIKLVSPVLGDAMLQDAAITAKPDFSEGQDFVLRLKREEGGAFTEEEVSEIYDRVNPDRDPEGINFSVTDGGESLEFMDGSRFGDGPYTSDMFDAYVRTVSEAVGSGFAVADAFSVESEYHDAGSYEGGTTADPGKVWSVLGLGQRPDLQEAAVLDLYDPIWEVYRDTAEQLGIGPIQGHPLADKRGQLSFDKFEGLTDTRTFSQTSKKPKKTITAYKVFRTLPSRPGEIFPLFIGKTEAVPMGEWVEAEYLPTKGFADRPGWHAGPLPIVPPQLLSRKTGKQQPLHVIAEVELPADRNWQDVANETRTQDIRDQVPEDGFYVWRRPESQGNWWFIGGALKVNRILSPEEIESIIENPPKSAVSIDVDPSEKGPLKINRNRVELKSDDRGRISFTRDGRAIIQLLAASQGDASTFMHELAHYFLEQRRKLIEDGRATDTVVEHMDDVMKWLEIEELDQLDQPYADGRMFDGEVDIPHERLARAFEVYLVEGTAPVKELEGTFQVFREWIAAAYRGVKAVAKNRGIVLDQDIVDVFDRMLVIEREVDELVNVEAGPTFKSAAEMGVTEDEYERYLALYERAVETAKQKLSKRFIGKVRRERKEARQKIRDAVRERVEQEHADDEAWQALSWLRRGTVPEGSALVADTDVGLDYGMVADLYGGNIDRIIEILDDKPGSGRRVIAGPRQEGLDPNDVASIFGFRSGRALVDAMIAAVPLDEKVTDEVNTQMAARPELALDEDAIAEGALEAVADLPREDVLRAELVALRTLASSPDLQAAQAALGDAESVPTAEEARAAVQVAQEALTEAIERGDPQAQRDAEIAVAAAQDRLQAARSARRGGVQATRRIREIEAGLKSTTLRRKAAKLVGVVRVGDLRTQRRAWNSTVLREGKKAREAIARRDYVSAAESLERQLLAHHSIELISRYIDNVDKQRKRVAKFYKKGEQDKLRRAGFDGATVIVNLLDQFDFRASARTAGEGVAGRRIVREAKRARVAETEQTLLQFAKAAEEDGWVLDIDEYFLNAPTMSWKDMEIDHFNGLVSTINGIEKVSRGEVKRRNEQQRVTMMQAAQTIADRVRTLWPTQQAQRRISPTKIEEWQARLKSGDALLLKREELFDFLGGDDIDANPLREFIWEPIQQAAERELDLQEKFTVRLRQAIDGVDWNRWQQDVELPMLNGYKAKFHEIVAMALNYGNESNWRKLVEGYANDQDHRWTEQGIRDAIMNNLTASDWNFVQDVWDILEDLRPMIWQTHFDVTGTYPKEIQSRPFVTPSGQIMRGGYYPVVYDPIKDKTEVTQRLLDKADQLGMLGASWIRPDTDHGFVEARSDSYARPIWLDVNVMANHIEKAIHDITHREAIIQVYGITQQAPMRKAIRDTWGQEYVETIDKWVKAQARERFSFSHNGRTIDKMVRGMRSNITMMGLGYRLSTIFLQPLGLSNSMGEIGAGWMARAAQEVLRNPHQSIVEVIGSHDGSVQPLSREMHHRVGNNDRDIRHEMRLLKGKVGPAAQVRRYAYHGIGYTDMITSVITWRAQYAKSLDTHGDQQRAVREADRSVRRSQGSGLAKDLVEFQEYGGAIQFAAMFYSYASALYAQQRRAALTAQYNYVGTGTEVALHKKRDFPRALARWMASIVIPQVIASMAAGYGPEDDEHWQAWLAKELISAHSMPLPFFRDVIQGATQGRLGAGPLMRMFEAPIALGYDIAKIVGDDPDWERTLRDGLKTTGYFAGLPLGQLEIWVDNFWEDQRDFQIQDLIYRKPRDRR